MMRQSLLFFALFLGFATSLYGELSRAPYLQLSSENSIHLAWRTTHKSVPSIRFGLSKSNLDQSVRPEDIIVRRTLKDGKGESGLTPPPLHTAPRGTYQFEAKLAGLKPDTLYYYAVFDGLKQFFRA